MRPILHLLTTVAVVDALGRGGAGVTRILDLGCGTGVGGAAWALACATPPALHGVDANTWALDEARWNWRHLALRGRTERGDLVNAARDWSRRPSLAKTAVIAGWSVNELDAAKREALLPLLLELHERGAAVLVIEPIAKAATPWWPAWSVPFERAGGRRDEWSFDVELPAPLARMAEAAGLRAETLRARSLYLCP